MKKALLFMAIGASLALGAVRLAAVPATVTTVTGEVIEISGYAMKDSRGEEGAEAGKFRADGGFPVGILGDDGEVYVAVYKNPAPASALEPGNKILGDLMGLQVVSRGKLYRAGGVNVFEISVVSEM